MRSFFFWQKQKSKKGILPVFRWKKKIMTEIDEITEEIVIK